MIKKYILGSLLRLFGLIGTFVNAYEGSFSQTNTFINRIDIGLVGTSNGIKIGTIQDSNFNFNSDDGKFFQYIVPPNGNVLSYWWQSDGIHYTVKYNGNTGFENGKINGFYLCADTNNGPGSSYYPLNTRDNCTFNTGFNNLINYTVGADRQFYACNNGTPNNPNSTFTNCIVCLHNNGYVCIDKSNVSNVKNEYLTTATVKGKAGYNPYNTTENRNNNNTPNCITIKQLMNNYGKNYNTGLCYNSTLRYENGQIQTVEKKDIFTVFTNYNEYTNRLSIYQNQCTNPSTQENCENAFSGQREKYSIIANIWNGGVDRKNIWNYCNLGLNYDPNATTCTASGYIAEPPTSEEIIDNIKENGIKLLNRPGTGNVFNSLLGEGQTRDDINIYDIIGNFTQIKDKISSLFRERKGTNGIIPDYILWLIMITLLLTVLFKK